MSKQHAFIYGLLDPELNTIFYVGQTDDPPRRLFEHLRPKASDTSRRADCIRSMNVQGIAPEMVILDEGVSEKIYLDSLEEAWIWKLIREHQPLLNQKLERYANGYFWATQTPEEWHDFYENGGQEANSEEVEKAWQRHLALGF